MPFQGVLGNFNRTVRRILGDTMTKKETSGATFMSHRFLCVYKYRLNGNVDVLTLQGQGEPYILTLYSFHLHR